MSTLNLPIRKISVYFLLIFILSGCTKSRVYKEYITYVRDNLRLEFSVPENMMSFPEKKERDDEFLTFGEEYQGIRGVPIFFNGPSIQLSPNCTVLMLKPGESSRRAAAIKRYPPSEKGGIRTDISFRNTPTDNKKAFKPGISWMLINCGMPWKPDFYNSVTPLESEQADLLALEKLEEQKKKMESLREKYETHLEHNDLTEKANCDEIILVRIPHLEKIRYYAMAKDRYDESVDVLIQTKATTCYNVCLHEHSPYWEINMLFFLDETQTTIEDCLTKMLDWIRFTTFED